MLRLPAVAGRFYPGDPRRLTQEVRSFAQAQTSFEKIVCRACLVPHAGYMYSGHVAGAVYASVEIPKRIIVLGVRHFPHGEEAAIVGQGSWRTPLGDALIDAELAGKISRACPLLREDDAAHQDEHSLEVQLPFVQVLSPGFRFVPIALGTIAFDDLTMVGQSLGSVLAADPDVLLLTTSDFNHYEDDTVTRQKDRLAIERILAFDPGGLLDVCRKNKISMCGLGPAVSMLTALNSLGLHQAELIKYATSAEVSGDTRSVVGYGGLRFH